MKIAGGVSLVLGGTLFCFLASIQESSYLITQHCEVRADGRWCDGTSDRPSVLIPFIAGCHAPDFAPPALMEKVQPGDGVEWNYHRNGLSGLSYWEYEIFRGAERIRVTHGTGLHVLVHLFAVVAPILIWLMVFTCRGGVCLKEGLAMMHTALKYQRPRSIATPPHAAGEDQPPPRGRDGFIPA